VESVPKNGKTYGIGLLVVVLKDLQLKEKPPRDFQIMSLG
jgi:hypothetical protein